MVILILTIKLKPFDEFLWDLHWEVTNHQNFVKIYLAFFGLCDLYHKGQENEGQK